MEQEPHNLPTESDPERTVAVPRFDADEVKTARPVMPFGGRGNDVEVPSNGPYVALPAGRRHRSLAAVVALTLAAAAVIGLGAAMYHRIEPSPARVSDSSSGVTAETPGGETEQPPPAQPSRRAQRAQASEVTGVQFPPPSGHARATERRARRGDVEDGDSEDEDEEEDEEGEGRRRPRYSRGEGEKIERRVRRIERARREIRRAKEIFEDFDQE